MPGRSDPNLDAAVLLERRRAQNRLAQHRFRQKKLAAKAKLAASQDVTDVAGSNNITLPSSERDSPDASTQAAVATTSSPMPSLGKLPEQTSFRLQTPTGLAGSISTTLGPSPFVDLFPDFYAGSAASSSSSASFAAEASSSYPSDRSSQDATSSRSESSTSPSSSESTTDSIERSLDPSGMSLDSEGHEGLEVICSPSHTDGSAFNAYGSSYETNRYDPLDLEPIGSRMPGVGRPSKTSPNVTDAYLSLELAQTLTQEKGMLAVVLLHTGSPSLAALRATFLNPTADQTFAPKSPFAKAFYHNAVTIGFLDNDLRTCAGMSSIDRVWPQRSAPALLGLPIPVVSPDPSEPRPSPYTVPPSLSASSEERRAQQLKDNPHMHPTKLQLENPHSILIDTLPWPHVRDALIRLCLAGVTDGHEIKCDMIGRAFDCIGDGHTFTIHGDDPCDPESWEVSEVFAKRYSVVLDKSIIRRTNFWRRMRGLPNLDLGEQKSQGEWIVNALMSASSTFL